MAATAGMTSAADTGATLRDEEVEARDAAEHGAGHSALKERPQITAAPDVSTPKEERCAHDPQHVGQAERGEWHASDAQPRTMVDRYRRGSGGDDTTSEPTTLPRPHARERERECSGSAYVAVSDDERQQDLQRSGDHRDGEDERRGQVAEALAQIVQIVQRGSREKKPSAMPRTAPTPTRWAGDIVVRSRCTSEPSTHWSAPPTHSATSAAHTAGAKSSCSSREHPARKRPGRVQSGAPRDALHSGDPSFATIMKVAKSLGLRLEFPSRSLIGVRHARRWHIPRSPGTRQTDHMTFTPDRIWPATAEALMRSRFAAFKDGDAEWLLASWHPSTRPSTLDLSSGELAELMARAKREGLDRSAAIRAAVRAWARTA